MNLIKLVKNFLSKKKKIAQVEDPGIIWEAERPVFKPTRHFLTDQISVKDPSIIHHDGMWYMAYTARGIIPNNGEHKDPIKYTPPRNTSIDIDRSKGKNKIGNCKKSKSKKKKNKIRKRIKHGNMAYSLGISASLTLEGFDSAHRYNLSPLSPFGSYVAAPHLFYFTPQKKWYLIAQAKQRNHKYVPIYSINEDISNPNGWSKFNILVEKKDLRKWIDFWVICDEQKAYLFLTRSHKDMYFMTTPLEDFPNGFDNLTKAKGSILVHEASNIYKIKDTQNYLMLTESRDEQGKRLFLYSVSQALDGKWSESRIFARIDHVKFKSQKNRWTNQVSHGELIRAGIDQNMEIELSSKLRFLIQGTNQYDETHYTKIPWRIGIIEAAVIKNEQVFYSH